METVKGSGSSVGGAPAGADGISDIRRLGFPGSCIKNRKDFFGDG